MSVTYREAGVDIDAADNLVDKIKPMAARTNMAHVLGGVGGFAGLSNLPSDIKDPVLVSGTDGVGTKLKVAFATGVHNTIGQDLVAMCVNDVITTGARPLFFLDYFGCGKLDVGTAEAVISGIADGCVHSDCALLGGETAELPGMYPAGEYDLAGFSVGVVGRNDMLGKHRTKIGDKIIAVAASGLHSNGYSLARHVLESVMGLKFDQKHPALSGTLGEALLTPTRIYARAVRSLCEALGENLHAIAHITGGGVPGNLNRVIVDDIDAEVKLDHERPAIFKLIQEGGPVEEAEMLRTFNIGIGLMIMVAPGSEAQTISLLEAAGEKAWLCGELVQGAGPCTVKVL